MRRGKLCYFLKNTKDDAAVDTSKAVDNTVVFGEIKGDASREDGGGKMARRVAPSPAQQTETSGLSGTDTFACRTRGGGQHTKYGQSAYLTA